MVSLDDPEKNKAFADSLETTQTLLSDPSGDVADAYGVAGFGGFFAKRWTFYIDREGVIRAIDREVDVDTAGQDIAKRLGELGFPKRESSTQGLSQDEAQALVAAPGRSADDRKLDARRKPALLLVFSGVGRGMKVADLGAGGGYTTELLARAVGPEGSVIGHNTPYVIEKYVKESWPARLAKPELANVVRADRSFEDPLPEGTSGLEVVTMIFVYHDTLIGDTDRAAMNRRLLDAMAPGGALIVVDHHAKSDAGPEVAETLHRIPEALLRSELEAAGFQFEADADFMRNPDDPRSAPFFEMKTPTDAFVHRYRKPR